jgi:hypothetical protein
VFAVKHGIKDPTFGHVPKVTLSWRGMQNKDKVKADPVQPLGAQRHETDSLTFLVVGAGRVQIVLETALS